MKTRVALALLLATAVLAKKGGGGGGGSSHSTGGESSSSSGSGSKSSSSGYGDSVDASDFSWDPSLLAEFILAIVFGVFTLFGGGYWLAKRFDPPLNIPGVRTLYWSTWVVWIFSLLDFILSASSAGSYAHALAVYEFYDYDAVNFWSMLQTEQATLAFECLATAGWMFVLLTLTHAVWGATGADIGHSPRTPFLFHATLVFLVLSALSGGIVIPALEGADGYNNTLAEAKVVNGLYVAYALVTLIAAFLLLATVFRARKATRLVEGCQSSDPLRWIMFIAVPLWIITELVRFILADIEMADLTSGAYLSLVFDPNILMFGIASLTTITVLPIVIMDAKKGKEFDA
ncbi:hypothetical protein DL96DRAFT_1682816 [Flagelloscypha sp. PMI_526]|nr:hypothetical protein DL96DRAFT_1682816 [Flagelloscypha sp. PMI_526]